MSGSDWELQKAVYTALTNDATLMAAISGVYDSPDQDDTDFPFVTIGENIQSAWDTDDDPGDSNLFTVHVWSREGGRKETKIVNGFVYDILNRNKLSVTGYQTVDCISENSQVLRDPDGKTYHGVNEFRITLLEA